MSNALDQSKSDAFADQMVGVLNNGAIALMTSIGHQTGLFDTMAGLSPSTSERIAEAAGLNERYVREWLGAMVTGGIVNHDPVEQTYSLPAEHSAWLTRAAGTDNLAQQAQYIPLLGSVEQGIIECFHNGGGVPYSAYPRFQQVMAEESGAIHDATLIDTTLPLIPDIVERLQIGIDVADIGCGSGHAINLMAQAFPNSQFIGYDFSQEGVAVGREEAERMRLSNARFEARDVENLDLSGQYDFITAFDAIHDQAQPTKVLQGIAHALRPEGIFLMVDIAASSNVAENLDHVIGPLMYTVSCMHCMTVSLALDGEGLGAMWGEQKARQMLAEAGFAYVSVKRIDSDIFNYYYIATKG
ncbi:MAG: methyltransferase domain-containing protein [Chloroflexi bacterium]|nr:methyltransferase domain-containing protein [Chloroflexota bacterium]